MVEQPPASSALMDGRPLRLSRLPATPQAHALTAAVTDLVAQQATGRRIGPGKLRSLTTTLGTILGGLLHAAERQRVASVRKGHRGSQEASGIGYKDLWARLDELQRCGLIGVALGTKGEVLEGVFRGQPTRVWATDRLLAMASQAGVGLADLDQHWTLSETLQRPPEASNGFEPVVVRDVRGWVSAARLAGFDGDIDAVAATVRLLNEHLASAVIRGCRFPVLQQRCGGDLRLGGRMYAVGEGDDYQKMAQARRASITIDGSAVVEVDATASQFSIFLALAGIKLAADPYLFPGIPRDAVKAFVTQALGAGRVLSRWGRDTDAEIRRTRFSLVRAAVFAMYPALADVPAILPADLRDLPPPDGAGWAAGQFLAGVEASIMRAALDTLRCGGIVALPIFDGLIIKQADAGAAQAALAAAYRDRLGVSVAIKTSVSAGSTL